MYFVRKFLVFFLALLLPIFLFALAVDTGIIKIGGSSTSVKKVLADSGVYASAINSAFDQAKNTGGAQDDGITLTDPGIKAAAEKTFTPQYLQQSTETIIDSVYGWLDGSTPVPDFRIDLTSLKASFAAEAALAAQQRATTLPKCPPALSPSSFDPFSASCLPGGVTPAIAAAQTKEDLTSGKGFLENPVITADSIKASGSSQSVFTDQLKQAPDNYQKIKKSPMILGLLSLLTALGIVFISQSRRKGFRRVGIIFLSVGLFLILLASLLNYSISHGALNNLNKLNNAVLAEQIRNVAIALARNLDKTYWIFGGTYAALGIAAIAGPMLIHKGKGRPMQEEHVAEIPPPPKEPETPAVHTPAPKKKPPKKILIQ